jgi:hypothetical protein
MQLEIRSEYSHPKKIFDKKKIKLHCDLILYSKRYVGNLEIILSTITSSFKAIRANMIVHMEKEG